jgi:hypothetical protein
VFTVTSELPEIANFPLSVEPTPDTKANVRFVASEPKVPTTVFAGWFSFTELPVRVSVGAAAWLLQLIASTNGTRSQAIRPREVGSAEGGRGSGVMIWECESLRGVQRANGADAVEGDGPLRA